MVVTWTGLDWYEVRNIDAFAPNRINFKAALILPLPPDPLLQVPQLFLQTSTENKNYIKSFHPWREKTLCCAAHRQSFHQVSIVAHFKLFNFFPFFLTVKNALQLPIHKVFDQFLTIFWNIFEKFLMASILTSKSNCKKCNGRRRCQLPERECGKKLIKNFVEWQR